MEDTISPHESAQDFPAFAATLPPAERRLASRLEGFGDIVFGFAVSQCALQLPVKAGHVDLTQPLAILLYIGTFALIASLWLIYHRLMSGAYRPEPLDLLLAFAFLALVSLMPFAMYAVSHASQSFSGAQAAVAQYTSLYAAMTAVAALVSLRNLRRGYRIVGERENDRAWGGFLRQFAVCGVMLVALAIDLKSGPEKALPVYPCIAVVILTIRRLFAHAPSARFLLLSEERPAKISEQLHEERVEASG